MKQSPRRHRSQTRLQPSRVPHRAWILCALLTLHLPALTQAATWREDFAADPQLHGWQTFGTPGLHNWDPNNQRLAIRWDSTLPNAHFARPLGSLVTRQDPFRLAFDLQLDSIQLGVDPAKPYTFQIGLGLIHRNELTRTNLLRGTGIHPIHGPRNLVEFSYFPDSGFGATVSPAMISSNNQFAATFAFPLELRTGVVYRVELTFTPANQTLVTRLTTHGSPAGIISDIQLDASFGDFQVDHLGVFNYSDEGQSPPEFAGSVRGAGWIDNLELTAPDSPVTNLTLARTADTCRIRFIGQPGWSYRIHRSEALVDWIDLGAPTPGTAPDEWLHTDRNPLANRAFYRVEALRQ